MGDIYLFLYLLGSFKTFLIFILVLTGIVVVGTIMGHYVYSFENEPRKLMGEDEEDFSKKVDSYNYVLRLLKKWIKASIIVFIIAGTLLCFLPSRGDAILFLALKQVDMYNEVTLNSNLNPEAFVESIDKVFDLVNNSIERINSSLSK